MDNVSYFFPPDLTETHRKVPVDQFSLEVEVIGHVPSAGKATKKQKKQVITWPECLDLLPPERKQQIILDVLVEAARVDTEATAVTKEG